MKIFQVDVPGRLLVACTYRASTAECLAILSHVMCMTFDFKALKSYRTTLLSYFLDDEREDHWT